MKNFYSFIFILGVLALSAQPQSPGRTCGTPTLPLQFETWLKSVTPAPSASKFSSSSIQSVFNIPVIVHVIHNNEAVNGVSATSGNNLNAAQIIDQINILNTDFNGLNADTSLIPAVFKPALGKLQVNFCLAVVNPTGGILAEPGIDRINRIAKGWSAFPYSQSYIDANVKPNSIWDPNKYLNIWVCPLSSGLLGYATFPNPGTSGLSGLTGSFGTATSDGVVILNSSFGSIGTAQFGSYNLGRTATHEIGHWMGLRHIWGDATCGTDYVNDTPPAQNANYNCPAYPYKLGVCTGNTTGEMTMNFMDYTNDACMYMFTKDQKIRTQLILTNSTMRTALITSTVCNLPSVGTDVGISYVARPSYTQNFNCNNYVDPIINVTNYGTTTISSFVVSYNVDGVNTQTMSWTGTLTPNNSFTLAIPQISGLGNGAHTFSALISNPNAGADINPGNNSNMQNFTLANVMNLSVNAPTVCAGSTAVLSASGAVNYSWGPGITTSTYAVSPAMTTTYSVAGSNTACTLVKTATVTVLPGPTISVSGATACAGESSTLTASGALSFTWSNSSNSSSITVSPFITSSYSVSGTNSLNCVSTAISTVNVLPTPTLAANNVTICAGGTATLSVSGANSYTWANGTTGNTISLTPSSYTVLSVAGNIGTCSDTETVSVSIGSALSVFISPSSPSVCLGASVSFTASGANSYTWSNGPQSNVNSVSPSSNTTYTVLALAATCPGSQVVTVVVNPLPQTTLSFTNVSCFGGSNGILSAGSTGNGPFSYTYSAGPQNLPAGTYTVITRDINGCQSQQSAVISQPPALVSQSSTSITTCPSACDGAAQVQVSGGTAPYTGTLYPGGVVNSLVNLCAGSYTYLIGDANGCVLASAFSVSPGNAGVVISSTVTHVSCASCVDATLTAQGMSGNAPYSYVWAPGPMLGPVYVDVGADCYSLTVTDAEGCFTETVLCVYFDVSVEQQVLSGASLWPNPGTGQYRLSFLHEAQRDLKVLDARGRLVYEAQCHTSDAEINIGSFAQGIYFLVIREGEKTYTLRLIRN